MKFVLVPVTAKHVAAVASGAYLGQIAVSKLISRRHRKQIEVRDAIISDLRTLATDLSVSLYPLDPDRHHQIFTDIRFEQITRGMDV